MNIPNKKSNYKNRSYYLQNISYFILDKHNINIINNLIKSIIPNLPIKSIEIMAGKGNFSLCLKKYSSHIINLIATTDDYSWSFINNPKSHVENIDAIEAIKKYKPDMIIMSWPPMDNTATKVVKNMEIGQYMLYIGEWKWGCTANDAFFDIVERCCEVHFTNEEFNTFPGIHDFPVIIRKVRN